MTVRKKLVISNILMILVPVVFAVVFLFVAMDTYMHPYWDPIEDMYNDGNGAYSVQSLIYSYRDSFTSADTKRKTADFEKEITAFGYHFCLFNDGKITYNTLSDEEMNAINRYLPYSDDETGSCTMNTESCSIVKNTFSADNGKCTVLAVCMYENVSPVGQESYLKKYILSFIVLYILCFFAVVIITNFFLSRWIASTVLKPLDILKKSSREIGSGNLEAKPEYDRPDEFGEACREFDEMRIRLKESVETRLRYEQYRRELIGGISHDLRTPLTSIKGYVEGLKDGIADTEEKRRHYYDAIQTRAGSMEALVDSLSTFARLENKRYRYYLQPADMNEFLLQLTGEYREDAAKKNAVILYDNNAENTKVLLDLQEMQRVFVNLFENSIKYRKSSESVIRITLRNVENNLEIKVADNGPGVSDGELEKIFNSFYRGDQARTNPENGSGLGLAIVKQIIEGHMGTIKAYNNQGLTIQISLPLYTHEAGQAHEKDTDH